MRNLVSAHITQRQFGLLGEPRVNVLELNLDLDKWKVALDGSTHSADIEADKKVANDDGISGTPAFLIVPGSAPQGYFVNGAQSYSKFRKLIERALAEAR